MSRNAINRSGEMAVFVRAVELGGFSAAARECCMTPSAVSKLVQRLEERLGVRLINRSTRRLQLTPEGCAFHERAARILADIDDAERQAAAGDVPAGRVRINASASFSTHVLMPLLPELLSAYPDLSVDIIQTDAVVDLMAERVDIAIRAGALKASRLIARKLGSTSMTIVGAPSYLARCGEPGSLDELKAHNRLSLSYARAVDGWPLLSNGETILLPPGEKVRVSDGKDCAAWCLPASDWQGWRPSRFATTSMPAGWCRLSNISIRGIEKPSMRCFKARAARCHRASG